MFSQRFLDYAPEYFRDTAVQMIYHSDPVEVPADLFIPLSILKSNSALQSIVHYLARTHNLSYTAIARLLNRDPRTIWATYHAKTVQYTVDESQLIPLSILTNRRLSVLESIVFYLVTTQGLTITAIAVLLGKNYQTIRTVYRRAIQKL